jgi:hypothetical protein
MKADRSSRNKHNAMQIQWNGYSPIAKHSCTNYRVGLDIMSCAIYIKTDTMILKDVLVCLKKLLYSLVTSTGQERCIQ